MNRPLLLRLLPEPMRASAWARFYRGRHRHWQALYSGARLQYAPEIAMDLVPGDVISDNIAFTGTYERPLTKRVVEVAKSGGCLVDVGANLGYFSLLWAANSPRGSCIAVEASPRNIEFLRKNVVRNRLDDRIDIVPYAAGSDSGRASFDVGPDEQTGWGGYAPAGTAGTIEVEVIRLDDHMAIDKPIALLKIDTEGADTWVLMGCERLLRARVVREIHYEQNKSRMRALGIPLDSAQEFLRSVGYSPRPLGNPKGNAVEWAAVPS